MKKPSAALLRSLSTKLSSRRRPTVAPWPPHVSAFDRHLSADLDDLLPLPLTSAATLAKALTVAASAQQTAIRSVTEINARCRHSYIDDTVDLLDACNVLRQRIQDIRKYVNSLSIATHWLEQQDSSVHVHKHSVHRAQAALCTCTVMEKRCMELETCGSSLRKLGERVARPESSSSSPSNGGEVDEMLDGSRAIALLVIGMANVALSFRTRRGVPMAVAQSTGSSSLSEMQRRAREEYEKRRREGVVVLEELRAAIAAARRLKGLLLLGGEGEVMIKGEEVREVVRELKSCCGELEVGVRELEEGVEGLYKGLIDVRMFLLGIASQTA